MMRKIRIFSLLLFVSANIVAGPIEAEDGNPDDILVIANMSVPVEKVGIKEIKAIFLKKKKTWSGGENAIPINAKENTPVRERFQRLVLGMAPEEEERYWIKQQIEVALKAPPEFSRTQKAVFALRNSVSYVLRKDYSANVSKIILVIPAQ